MEIASTKVCSDCKHEKPLSDFAKAKLCKDGHESFCKVCRKKRYGGSEQIKPKRMARYERKMAMTEKACSCCKETKLVSEFYYDKKRELYSARCKKCVKEHSKVYWTKEKRNKYVQENPEKIRQWAKMARLKNKLENMNNPKIIFNKICTSCGKEKPIAEFARSLMRKDGYAGKCRTCINESKTIIRNDPVKGEKQTIRIKTYRDINRKRLSEAEKIRYQRNKLNNIANPTNKENKSCSRCKQQKPITEFNRLLRNLDGYDSRCKICRRLTVKEWLNSQKAKTSERVYLQV